MITFGVQGPALASLPLKIRYRCNPGFTYYTHVPSRFALFLRWLSVGI